MLNSTVSDHDMKIRLADDSHVLPRSMGQHNERYFYCRVLPSRSMGYGFIWNSSGDGALSAGWFHPFYMGTPGRLTILIALRLQYWLLRVPSLQCRGCSGPPQK
jgi:hypothetical protein